MSWAAPKSRPWTVTLTPRRAVDGFNAMDGARPSLAAGGPDEPADSVLGGGYALAEGVGVARLAAEAVPADGGGVVAGPGLGPPPLRSMLVGVRVGARRLDGVLVGRGSVAAGAATGGSVAVAVLLLVTGTAVLVLVAASRVAVLVAAGLVGTTTGGNVADGRASGGNVADGRASGGNVADGRASGGSVADGRASGVADGRARPPPKPCSLR